MKNKIVYKDDQGEIIGNLKPIPDFLPPPTMLAKREKRIKISLNVSDESLNFYRKVAKRMGIGYQKLMRATLDAYAQAHQKGAA